jgi:hypothetical protein
MEEDVLVLGHTEIAVVEGDMENRNNIGHYNDINFDISLN